MQLHLLIYLEQNVISHKKVKNTILEQYVPEWTLDSLEYNYQDDLINQEQKRRKLKKTLKIKYKYTLGCYTKKEIEALFLSDLTYNIIWLNGIKLTFIYFFYKHLLLSSRLLFPTESVGRRRRSPKVIVKIFIYLCSSAVICKLRDFTQEYLKHYENVTYYKFWLTHLIFCCCNIFLC